MNNAVKIGGAVLGLGVLVFGGLIGLVASQPGELTASQTIEVAASPDDMAPYARDLKMWNEWSPWADIDPNVQSAFSDPSAGKDAWYTWEGNDEVGKGKMTVTVDDPGKVVHAIAFELPFEGDADSTIEWSGTAEKTTITWSFRQQADFGTKAANLAMGIEDMLAKDYAKGLANLKPIVEAAAKDRMQREKEAEEAAKLAEAETEGEEGEAPPAEATP